ncbi:uncharacterized protein TNCV_3230131 [Trichonephila clavipes]|nr:uncharacterized protein TNCV_3230131 [Trichonephila clavipes]
MYETPVASGEDLLTRIVVASVDISSTPDSDNPSSVGERQCLQTAIFRQDGATPQIGRQVKALLSANSGARSSDSNPRDFWLWGFLKDRVCRGGIRTLPYLKANSTRHVAEISRELLRATTENAINALSTRY